LTFNVKAAQQPPVGAIIVRVLMIEARWAIRVAHDLRRAGHALDSLLKEVGLVRVDLASPDNRISYAAYVGLIERAAMLLADPGYGLKLGASHDIRDNGLLGFLALNSPTLSDALANVERYVSVTNEGIDAVFEHDGEGSALRFREADASLRGLRHNSEQAAAQVVRGARELTRKKATPVRVEFMHGRPNESIDYEGTLGCPIKFHAKWDGVVYSKETLQLPVIGADNKLLHVLEGACRKIIGPAPRKHDLVHSVREYVFQRLAKGAVPFDDVAHHFHMSSKTLERRLSERGTGYRELVDAIRCDLAKHYLADTAVRLQQIAYLLGYSEPAPLVRAFKRWTGSTPMQYRAKLR
jgi:AraC-like DNA-binding protein